MFEPSPPFVEVGGSYFTSSRSDTQLGHVACRTAYAQINEKTAQKGRKGEHCGAMIRRTLRCNKWCNPKLSMQGIVA